MKNNRKEGYWKEEKEKGKVSKKGASERYERKEGRGKEDGRIGREVVITSPS